MPQRSKGGNIKHRVKPMAKHGRAVKVETTDTFKKVYLYNRNIYVQPVVYIVKNACRNFQSL